MNIKSLKKKKKKLKAMLKDQSLSQFSLGKMVIYTHLYRFCQAKGICFNYNKSLAEITLLKHI